MRRKISKIIIHCSGTNPEQDFTGQDIDSWHRAKGWSECGYHFVIRLDGTLDWCRSLSKKGAHCYGQNLGSIGICYISGVDMDGNPSDTRTDAQKRCLRAIIGILKTDYPNATVKGHRDYSTDLNGDGIISPSEFMKACPSFDVTAENYG